MWRCGDEEGEDEGAGCGLCTAERDSQSQPASQGTPANLPEERQHTAHPLSRLCIQGNQHSNVGSQAN